MSFAAQIDAGCYSAGQPTAAQLLQLRQDGFGRIIDLRAASEDRGFDEPAAAAACGLQYLTLPVVDDKDLTLARVRQLDAWLTQPHAPKTLIHCGSANRVGALLALRAGWLQGATPEQAIAVGRAAGLKAMEAAVRVALAHGPQ